MPTHADPRRSNHGGHTPSTLYPDLASGTPLQSRFDWYEFTADRLDDGRVAPALALATGGSLVRGVGRNGYAHATSVVVAEETVATVFGGSAREGEVHVSIPGYSCELLVPTVRRIWPDHRVSRADSALDFVADFDHLDLLALSFARDRNLKYRLVTNSDGGATRYLGAPSSEVMVRLYKKSEQLRAIHPERAADIPDGVVRAEIQARPGKRAPKERLAALESDDVWGLGAWARDFALTVLGVDPVRTSTHFRRPSDWSRALYFLGLQYRPTMERRALDVGMEQARSEVLAALGLAL